MTRDEKRRQLRLFRKFQKRPQLFLEHVMGIDTLEKYQANVIQTIADHERVAIAACHDLGKTYLIARIIIWYCICFPNCKVITTAPTYNQVKNILWAEIRSAHAKSLHPLGGVLNQTDWTLNEEGDWFAIGYTPKTSASTEAGQGTQSSFQGFHAAGGILVVFDEATGIPTMTWDMAEGVMTQQNVKWVAIGNPTSTASEFYKCFSSAAWKKVYLTCFDSPNLVANGITDKKLLQAEVNRVKAMSDAEAQATYKSYVAPRGYLLTLKWVVASIIKWGWEHPLTVSKIFGEFPASDDKALVSLGQVENAQRREYIPNKKDRKVIGVDVARYGSDSTVITAMHGKKVVKRLELFKLDGNLITGEILNLIRELEWDFADVIVVDATGVGASVVDGLNDVKSQRGSMLRKTEIRAAQFGAKADDGDPDNSEVQSHNELYFNLKARIFGLLRDDIKAENGIQLPENESVYGEELPAIRFSYNRKGQMVIESKDEFKKRTGRKSPDNADSLALANFGNYDSTLVGAFQTPEDQDEVDDRTITAPKSTIAGGLKRDRNW